MPTATLEKEWANPTFARCPTCGHLFSPARFGSEVFEGGPHDVDCPECETSFRIVTTVRYVFLSPAKELPPCPSASQA